MAKMRVAVVGAGISGLVAATVLTKGGAEVVLYEKEDYLGGHAKTHVIDDDVDLDLGFLFFNRVTYPNLMEFFESLGVEMEEVEMSFSVSLDRGKGYEWGNRNGISSVFAQKKNILNPYFWQMIREIALFKNDALMYLEDLENNPDINRDETLGHFIKSRGYSDGFQKAYLFPMCGSLWSCPVEGPVNFSAYSVLSLCRSHHLLQLFGRPQWHTLRWGTQNYVDKVREELESRGCQIRSSSKVLSVSIDNGCLITCEDGSKETYDVCIIATNAPDTLKMLGEQATCDETRVLRGFQYVYSNIFLHRDNNFMPQKPAAWSAQNFLKIGDDKVCLTYWLNVLQNIHDTEQPYLVTVNPPHNPEHILLKWSTGDPIPSIAASKASIELNHIQGKRGIWFCGGYQGYGFLEDGVKASLIAANSILTKNNVVLSNPKHMLPSVMERGARVCVTKFLGEYISTGSLILLEEGGTTFTFEGTKKKSLLKASLRIHNPQFYWKIATQGGLGLADAYIHGDFSLVDKNDGLQNLLMVLIANRDLKSSVSTKKVRWTPLLSNACTGSIKYFLQYASQQNTLTQDRRNISRHYDLSNELFALFLDETLTYSCGIFKSEDEDLKVAQMRKISLLIEKARINEEHEILEIGSGWGSLAIEVVKRTRCNYTGITLSEEQLKFAEMKAKEAGLQDRIKFLLCHYNQLPDTYKYDRIISCEMLEHVGHEHMEEFFGRCDSVLANDGLLVLQFTSIPDERYDEYRRSTEFIKEYIFPGACVPSLSRTTSAMAASSRLCVEQVENIGLHYIKTLRCWKENFLKHQSEIISLGFNEKFIRMWVYYFDYCIAGFKTCTLGNYQMVFSRPGNVSVLGDPFKGLPSAY